MTGTASRWKSTGYRVRPRRPLSASRGKGAAAPIAEGPAVRKASAPSAAVNDCRAGSRAAQGRALARTLPVAVVPKLRQK
jgi:hypothetical protein